MQTFNYIGAIHIHTTFSDGSKNVEEISKIAKKCGLDWIIITDHNTFDIKEGIYNGVYVIKGEEISNDETGHFLAFNTKNCIGEVPVSKAIELAHSQGGFGFAAHPHESKTRNNNAKPLRWADENIVPDGIEIWNWFSNWADNYNSKTIFNTMYSFLFRHSLVTKPCKDTLIWWDKLNNQTENIVPAIGGCDAHELIIKKYIIPVHVFPYKVHFKTLNNMITLRSPLNDDFNVAKTQILTSIKNGNNLIFNKKYYKNPILGKIFIKNNDEIILMGESIKLDNMTYLNIHLESEFLIKIIHNGNEILKTVDKNIHLLLNKKGKYRVEILRGDKGVIYTNPFKVI